MYFFELLGLTKALLPIWRRKSETSEEMTYAEIKAYKGAKGYYNGESAAKPSLDISHRGNGRNVQRACTPSGVSGRSSL